MRSLGREWLAHTGARPHLPVPFHLFFFNRHYCYCGCVDEVCLMSAMIWLCRVPCRLHEGKARISRKRQARRRCYVAATCNVKLVLELLCESVDPEAPQDASCSGHDTMVLLDNHTPVLGLLLNVRSMSDSLSGDDGEGSTHLGGRLGRACEPPKPPLRLEYKQKTRTRLCGSVGYKVGGVLKM